MSLQQVALQDRMEDILANTSSMIPISNCTLLNTIVLLQSMYFLPQISWARDQQLRMISTPENMADRIPTIIVRITKQWTLFSAVAIPKYPDTKKNTEDQTQAPNTSKPARSSYRHFPGSILILRLDKPQWRRTRLHKENGFSQYVWRHLSCRNLEWISSKNFAQQYRWRFLFHLDTFLGYPFLRTRNPTVAEQWLVPSKGSHHN